MSAPSGPETRRPARALSALIGKVIEPVTAKRGFASTDLLAAWPELVGPRFADCCQPERIQWPRKREGAETGGTLYIRVDGGRAVYLQHETGTLRERINSFLGFRAVAEIRFIQAPLPVKEERRAPRPPTPDQLAFIEKTLGSVEDESLKASLRELGRSLYATDNKP